MEKYVVSDEMWHLGNGFSDVDISFQYNLRENLVKKLESIFGKGSVDFIPERFIRNGLKKILPKNFPIVSLEKFYVNTPFHLEISRAFDANLNSLGIKERTGTENIDQQISNLISSGIKKIILVDDVLFSGGVWEIIQKLLNRRMEIREFVCGISVGEGRSRLAERGLKVSSVIHYEEVIDEICHRDFYAGLPYSGRMILDGSGMNIGAPYFYPFGNPIEWASIPRDKAGEFSVFCLQQSIRLWEYLEKLNNRPILCSQINRLPLGAPNNNTRFVDYLKSLL